MNTLEYYALQNKMNTRSDTFEKANQQAEFYGIIDSEIDNYQHYCHSHIQDTFFPGTSKKNITLIQSVISIKDIIKQTEKLKKDDTHLNKSNLKKSLSNISCGVIKQKNKEYVYYDELLGLNIKVAMFQRKTIFIMFCFPDYGINEEEGCDKEYIAHSTCMVLLPVDNNYKCYYINSHGCDMKNTNFYDIVLTKTRATHINYDRPIDIVFLEKYIEFLNDWSFISPAYPKIIFENTNEHVYYGTDLQNGDFEGVCWVYPLIIWYYFGKYLHTTREIKTSNGDVKLPKGVTLLKQKNLQLFIESMFIDFSEKYRNIFSEGLIEESNIYSIKLNNYIEQEEKNFTTKLIDAYMSFITQRILVNKIEN
tara:strand:+ start:201 stop:1295 length:1095 start_codon:yes stop_codon:yes gene_type:complete